MANGVLRVLAPGGHGICKLPYNPGGHAAASALVPRLLQHLQLVTLHDVKPAGHSLSSWHISWHSVPACPPTPLQPLWALLQTNFPDLDEERMEQVYHMTGGNARELRRTLPVLAVATPKEEEEVEGGEGPPQLPETSPARWPLPMEQALPQYTRRLRSKGVGSML